MAHYTEEEIDELLEAVSELIDDYNCYPDDYLDNSAVVTLLKILRQHPIYRTWAEALLKAPEQTAVDTKQHEMTERRRSVDRSATPSHIGE